MLGIPPTRQRKSLRYNEGEDIRIQNASAEKGDSTLAHVLLCCRRFKDIRNQELE
jgi:hypothetical protein